MKKPITPLLLASALALSSCGNPDAPPAQDGAGNALPEDQIT